MLWKNNPHRTSSASYNAEFMESVVKSSDPTVEKIVLLNIDGGGVLGTVSIEILVELEKLAGKPCRDIFTTFAGVSVGSVITTLLNGTNNNLGESAESVSEKFGEILKSCFHASLWHKVKTGFGLFGAVFDGRLKEEAIRKYWGEQRLSELAHLGFILATEVNTGQPYIFGRLFNTLEKGGDFLISEVINASTAAPVFFPSGLIHSTNSKKTYNFIDGAIAANNIDEIAIEVLLIKYPNAKLHVLSIGSKGANYAHGVQPVDWGLFPWVVKGDLVFRIMQSNTAMTSEIMGQKARANKSNLVQYLRIDPLLSKENSSQFNASSSYLHKLREFGRSVALEEKKQLADFLSNL